MSDSAVSKVAKPPLKRMLQNTIKRNLAIAVVMSITAAIAQKIFINDARKQVYSDFYKTYDANKAFNQIRNRGVFDSCEPDK